MVGILLGLMWSATTAVLPVDAEGWSWDRISTLLTQTGLTAGGFLSVFFLLLARGQLYTKRQYDEAIAAGVKATEALERGHAATTDVLKASYEAALDAVKESHAAVTAEKDKSTEHAERDRDYYRNGLEKQRERSDILSDRITEDVLPLLGANVALLKALPRVEDGETA